METQRTYHLCLANQAVRDNPGILDVAANAGVTHIWVGGFFMGYWSDRLGDIASTLRAIESRGMGAHVINLPLGHPGDSLGGYDDEIPHAPPPHWQMAERIDGTRFAGTSIHPPAIEENVEALRALAGMGVARVFLDDDFRLAEFIGTVGGCFCPAHRQSFLDRHGWGEGHWRELLGDIAARSPTPIVKRWADDNCDELSAAFRAMSSASSIELGNMVMFMGSEKAGVRLSDYAGAPVRVGEGAFDDNSFGSLKWKMNELFSSLFHRRFIAPELAYSETTAFPFDALSARHLAAKLAISTLSDVRHTMFMSGVTPFALSHWDVLAPAMKANAEIHRAIAGHVPRGPFKHFVGEPARYVGDDDPYSLFLALGVPFEVADSPPTEGWTFLCDADRDHLQPFPLGAATVVRPGGANGPGRTTVPENLDALLRWKESISAQLAGIPHVIGATPAVCAWYPTASCVVLWNLADEHKRIALRTGEAVREVEIDALGIALVEV